MPPDAEQRPELTSCNKQLQPQITANEQHELLLILLLLIVTFRRILITIPTFFESFQRTFLIRSSSICLLFHPDYCYDLLFTAMK